MQYADRLRRNKEKLKKYIELLEVSNKSKKGSTMQAPYIVKPQLKTNMIINQLAVHSTLSRQIL